MISSEPGVVTLGLTTPDEGIGELEATLLAALGLKPVVRRKGEHGGDEAQAEAEPAAAARPHPGRAAVGSARTAPDRPKL